MFGKLFIYVFEMGIDSFFVLVYKIYGLKGVGVCYINL